MYLVPLHPPRPLRDPLRGLGLGCLRTRAMTPAHPILSLRDGMNPRLRGGIRERECEREREPDQAGAN